MSYVVNNFYQNPGPYYGTGDKGEPVPGWGPLPVMAGGELVGVGRVTAAPAQTFAPEKTMYSTAEEKKIPAAAWLIGAGVLGLGLGIAYRRGLFKRRR